MNYVIDFEKLPKDAQVLADCISLVEDNKELSLERVLKFLKKHIEQTKKKALLSTSDEKFDEYVAEAERSIEIMNMLKLCFYEENVPKARGRGSRVQQPPRK